MTITDPVRTGCATKKTRPRKRKSYKYYVRQEKRLAKKLRSQINTLDNLLESETAVGEGAPCPKRIRAEIDLLLSVRQYLTSFSAKLVATKDAAKGYRGPVDRDLGEIAREIDVYLPCAEPINLIVEVKADGGERPILSYGIENRARQVLVKNCVQAMHGLTGYDQTLFNGGSKAAIEKIQTRYTMGHMHIGQLDVVACYQSFSAKEVADMLHLPEEVASYVLTAEHATIQANQKRRVSPSTEGEDTVSSYIGGDAAQPMCGEALDKARLGLSTGSKASPLIAELMLSLVFVALAKCADVKVTSYADNFLLQAGCSKSLRDAARKLRNALHTHPAGPLKGHKAEMLGPTDRFEFLGYSLSPDGQRIAVSLSAKNAEKARCIRAEGYRKIDAAKSMEEREKAVEEAVCSHKEFLAAFPAWPGRQRFHVKKMERMRRACRVPRSKTTV